MTRTGPVLAAVLLLALPALVVGTTSVPDPTVTVQEADDAVADSLVARWIEAVGGLEAFRRMESARYTLTTEMWDAGSGRLRRTRPRYVTLAKTPAGNVTRIERWEGDDFIVQTWDGSTARATLNGEELAPGDKDWDETAYVSGDVHYWTGLPYKLHDPGVNLHYLGTDEQGRHEVGVSFGEGVGLHDGDQWRYWFEDGRTWPVELAYREEGRENWNVLSFQDIREVDGYVYVGRRVHTNADGKVWKVLRTHDFELNPGPAPETFASP